MNFLVVVAAGSGSRFGGNLPKQYLELKGKPVLAHTLERFYAFDPGIRIVVVLNENHRDLWNSRIANYFESREIRLVTGGKNRFDSVKKGLEAIEGEGLVGIHDAVRPLVSLTCIERCYRSAEEDGSGIPALPMDESLRIIMDDGSSRNLERARLKRVQTPQVFNSSQIKEAYLKAGSSDFTDDATVYEHHFGHVRLVEGNPENIKITKASDLQLASLLL